MKTFYIDDLQIHNHVNPNIGYWLHHQIEGVEMPTLRVPTYDNPGEYGAFISNQLYGQRLITLDGTVSGSTLSEFNLRRRALESAIQIEKDENSVPVPKTLQFTTDDDLALQTYAYLNKFKMTMDKMLSANFLIEFVCPDFALDSQSLETIIFMPPSGGGVVYPVIYPVIYEAAVGGTGTIVNSGNADAYPVITLTGVLTNPVLYNATVNRFMALDLEIGADDTVVIDMKEKTILLNGSTPVLNTKELGSDWFWLVAGNNLFYLNTDEVGDDGSATIVYRNAYIGI